MVAPSFQLTSEQFIHGAGWYEGSGVVCTCTGGALSLSAMNWLQQSSKALWKILLQLTGTFFFFGASNKACEARTSMLVFLQNFHPRECGDVRSGLFASHGSAGKAGLRRDRLMRQLARCDPSLYGLLAVEADCCCLLEGLLAFCSRFSEFLAFHQVYFRFLVSFGLAACTKMFSTWDFGSAGAFQLFSKQNWPVYLLGSSLRSTLSCIVLLLPDGAETARRCVKHSLLERPGPKGLSPYKHKACLGRAWDVSVRSAFRKSKKSLSLSLSSGLEYDTGQNSGNVKG